MTCPIDLLDKAEQINARPQHSHWDTPCACLDLHKWDDRGVCYRCGEQRCGTMRSAGGEKRRCTRRDKHGKQHDFSER